MKAGSPRGTWFRNSRTLPATGGICGVATSTRPVASASASPAMPTRSTLALMSLAGIAAVKPVRSAVATRRLRRYEAWAGSSVMSARSPPASESSVT